VHELDIPPPDRLPFAIGGFDRIGRLPRAGSACAACVASGRAWPGRPTQPPSLSPHRHTFYEIAFVTTGQGAHVVDLTERELRPPMLCFVTPGQVRLWRRATGLEGRVILFTGEFLEAYPRDRDVLQTLGSIHSLTLSKKDGNAFAAVTREMADEYRMRAPGCTAILQACLHILLLRASRLSSMTPGGFRRGNSAAR